MKVIAARVYREPAVFLGLLSTIAIVVITIATGDPWTTATIAGAIAPLASALGIREFVTPVDNTGEHVQHDNQDVP